MKKVNKKVLKVVEHVMRNEAVYGIDRFPPACMGIFHQPKRPIIQKKSERYLTGVFYYYICSHRCYRNLIVYSKMTSIKRRY